MNSTTYIARAQAARRAASAAASDMVTAIRNERIEAHRYSPTDASHYTLGYLESFLVSQIMDLPVKYREQIITEMRRVTADKLETV